MKIFESVATILAYSSLVIFAICVTIALIINVFGFVNFSKKFDKFYFSIGAYFCLPLYGVSFLFQGITEKIERRDPILSFFLTIVSFLILVTLINRKKIKKIIERRKKKWIFWR